MPPRKHHPARNSAPGAKFSATRKSVRLVRRAARGAWLAVSFTALQFFADDAPETKRLFDHRTVDSLKAPLTRYRE
jgi:hypothetical protein